LSEVATGPLLRGERVVLRPMTHQDAAHLVRWSADADFAWFKWGRQPGRFVDEGAARQWIDRFAERAGKVFVIEHEGRPIGSANYRDMVPKARSCEVGIGIGESALWSRGLGRDALRLLVQHLVDDLGVHRVSLHVLAFNDRAIASYKACGFEVEGIERDAVMTDRGQYADDVVMAYIVGRPRTEFDPRPITLAGRHIRLEPLRMEHVEELYHAVEEEAIWTWLGDAPPRGISDIERYVRRALDLQIRGEHLPWLTRRAADGRAIGTTRYGAIDRANRSVEIGWTMLSREARRTAANTEAKYLQLRHAFEDIHALRVWLKTDLGNEPSQRAIERIGAKREGVIRNERVVAGGRVRDAVYYSIIDRDWTETKEHLQRLLDR
jgi:RimJ/RimL family protein N-acetyltransferase